jgi:hypothetical protein
LIEEQDKCLNHVHLFLTYIHPTHALSPKGQQRYLRYSSETPTFYHNKNTADVTDGKSIAVLLQSILGVIAINPLFAFYDTHGGKREVLFFYFASDTTRDTYSFSDSNIQNLQKIKLKLPSTTPKRDE